MTANYNFQHNVLRQAFESLPNHELKSIIITQDTARAKEIFYSAMEKSHLGFFNETYHFNCDFIIKNKLPMLIYYFDNTVISGVEFVGECFASVVVPKDKNHYYTLEYSLENNLVLGEWQNGSHINHGFYPQNNINDIINSIINLHTEDLLSNQNLTFNIDRKENLLLSSIRRTQSFITVLISLLLVIMIAFPIVAMIVKNETITYIPTKSAKLTELDANQKVYCETSGGKSIIYTKEYNTVKRYSFANKTMYYNSTSKQIRKGFATTSELKEYFGSNLTSGSPPLSYASPALIPIGITSVSILLITIVFLSLVLHKRTQAILFTLNRKNELFIKNKEAFDNEIISEYEFNKIQKSLLSQKILKNNKLFSLFKYLY